jgi:hypothetical protein
VTCLAHFFYLQALDLLTTLAFLSHGVREGNPMVRLVLQAAPSPLGGLVALKLFAVGLALYCWRNGRLHLLGRMNVFFAAVVIWNLLALVLRLRAVV